ncbi:hypothetical protein AX15_007179 [Amanita polypyramis BW_CC]|nr:hypothetical protein AX15_007179 [Amanita polypyramis BW_CC]
MNDLRTQDDFLLDNTDSDTDDSTKGAPPNFELPSPSSAQHKQNIFERVICAIGSLENLDIAAIQKDTDAEKQVLAVASILMEFFDGLPACLHGDMYSNQVMTAYRHFARLAFMNQLFALRKAFRLIRRPRSTFSTTVDVCWTDVVLAKLSLMSIALATGIYPDELGVPSSNSLICQQRHNYILAAMQLPESWSSIFSVVTSHNSSPAAKRVALRLLYTVYVLGSQLNDYDPWIATDADTEEFASTCLQMLNQAHSAVHGTLPIDNAQVAVHLAILISLFSSVRQSDNFKVDIEEVRPLSLSCLLEAMQAIIMYDIEAPVIYVAFPRNQLNPGLTMLMRWGNFFPWCWLLWDDNRIAGFECIVYSSTTWLSQLKYQYDDTVLFQADSMQRLYYFIQKHPYSSLRMLLQIILHAIDYLRGQENRGRLPLIFISVVSKSCWAIGRIMTSGTDVGRYMSSICSCMLNVFLCLHENADLEAIVVKEMTLESLVHVDDPTFRNHLKNVLAIMPCAIQVMVDNAIATAKSALTGTTEGSTVEGRISLVRDTVNFLVICWHKGCENCALRGPSSTLLNLTADLALAGFPLSQDLICCLWTALAVVSAYPNLAADMGAERRNELTDRVVTENNTSLIVVVSFANYIAAAKPDMGTLRYAEAWNYLSGTFLMVLRGDFPEEEDLITLVAPAICYALSVLLSIPGTKLYSSQTRPG